MLSVKEWLGVITVIMSIAATYYYYRDTLQRKTKPHAFTWLIWSILVFIAFAAQWLDGAGPGSWSTLTGAMACFGVFVFAISGYGEKTITRSDWACLIGAFLTLLLWWLTNNPVLSIILVIIIDALGTLPTYRKSWHKPHEETLATHSLSTAKALIALLALESYGFVSWAYIGFLFFANGSLVVLLIYRRAALKANEH